MKNQKLIKLHNPNKTKKTIKELMSIAIPTKKAKISKNSKSNKTKNLNKTRTVKMNLKITKTIKNSKSNKTKNLNKTRTVKTNLKITKTSQTPQLKKTRKRTKKINKNLTTKNPREKPVIQNPPLQKNPSTKILQTINLKPTITQIPMTKAPL